jgi:argininosuccinate synthase
MLVHEALPHDPVFADLEAMISSSQRRVCGEVRVALCQGRLEVTGCRSRYSLMDAAATYGETQSLWSGRDAAGFCRLYGLQGRLARAVATGRDS